MVQAFRAFTLLGAALLAGCAAEEPPRRDPVVVAVAAQAAGAGQVLRLNGVVAARTEATIAFRVPGQLVDRPVLRGEVVRKGQLLARLDVADVELAAREAVAQSSAADRAVAAAAAAASRTAADAKREAGLVAAGALSAQAFDATRAAADAAQADLAAAQARAAAARAVAARAANQRGYATLFADADGIVTDLLAEPGEVVAVGEPVLRLARAGARDVVVAVPERLRATLPRAGQAVVTAAGVTLPVQLRELSGAADPRTRSFEARFAISGGTALPPGLTANLELRPAGPASPVVTVPLGAVIERGQGPGVWIIGRDRRVARRPVKLGAVVDGRVEVISGLRPGERVVAMGAHLLTSGQRVRIGGLPK